MLRLILVCCLLLPGAVSAADLGSLKVSDVAASRQDIPLPRAAKAGGRYADGTLQGHYLLALTGPRLLYTQLASTPALFEEFKAMWQPVIKKAGLKALPPEYSPGFGALKYETTGGLAIRSFLCDTAHMPVSEAEMEKTLTGALDGEGMKVLGSFGIPVDPDTFTKPTVNIYYLTAYKEKQDQERQIRYLGLKSKAVRFDLDLLEAAGLKIVATYGANAVFYIGPRVGVALAVSNSEEMTAKQVAYHKDLIAKRGETLLGVRTEKPAEPVTSEGVKYAYLTKIYYSR
ncbi:MAG: hypothetical protein NDI60_02855 [Elusimicrobiales bacterium]|nr:hypothetical protein [Elusimicrobiales bacterium]